MSDVVAIVEQKALASIAPLRELTLTK